jgi:Ca-activated chloride channel family protein
MTASSAASPVPESDRASTRRAGVLEALEAGRRVPLPLAGLYITAKVAGLFAEVRVTQIFRNDHADPIEAIYTFPLGPSAAVSAFRMTAAGRTVHGVLAEREEARDRYAEALEQGHRTGLLEQERDDVFTIQVGNLPPREDIVIDITCSEALTLYDDRRTELRLPLVVAPRYIAGEAIDGAPSGQGTSADTHEVPDASRITPPRLLPGFDPDTGLDIVVEIEHAESLADLACSQHAIDVRGGDGRTRITLARERELLDRDFVLRWRVTREPNTPSVYYHRTPAGELFGALTIVAPAADALPRGRDVVFVLDRSGSMAGAKIASAARACSSVLASLGPADRFAVLAFSSGYSWLRSEESAGAFLTADQGGIARGQRLLRSIAAGGGTELDAALAEALSALQTPAGSDRSRIIVLLTDGEVGDEGRILHRLQAMRGDVRVFTVGIDTAVNGGLLQRLAAVGCGTCTLVEPGTRLELALEAIAREMGDPVATKLAVDTRGVVDPTPGRIPDLFAGRATTFYFRAQEPQAVTVRGERPDGATFTAGAQPAVVDVPAIAHLWARSRVMDLEDRYRMADDGRDAIKQEIVALSIARSVLTRFTAFLVVDEREAVGDPAARRTVVQPVHLPALWEEGATLSRWRYLRESSHNAPLALLAPSPAASRWNRALDAPVVGGFSPSALFRGSTRRPRRQVETTAAELRGVLETLQGAAGAAALTSLIDLVDRLSHLVAADGARLTRRGAILLAVLRELREAAGELLDGRMTKTVRFDAAVAAAVEALRPREPRRERVWEASV